MSGASSMPSPAARTQQSLSRAVLGLAQCRTRLMCLIMHRIACWQRISACSALTVLCAPDARLLHAWHSHWARHAGCQVQTLTK